jgi:hypothetical protein
MTIVIFIIAAVVSMPIVAVAIVSVACRREESAWSLGQPPQGPVEAAARRILAFHTEDSAWPQPRSYRQAVPAASALHSLGQPRSGPADSPRPALRSEVSIRTAA